MNEFQEDFVENLKFYRKQKGISQEKLAEMCDCATATIGCIEIYRQLPSFEMITKIAAALKVHPADLFLRNASSTVASTKEILLKELIPQIEDFVERRL